jgi:hypothetical protein
MFIFRANAEKLCELLLSTFLVTSQGVKIFATTDSAASRNSSRHTITKYLGIPIPSYFYAVARFVFRTRAVPFS